MRAAHSIGVPSLWNIRESVDWRTYFTQFGKDQVNPALETFAYPYRVIFVAEASRALFQKLNTRDNFSVIHNGLERTRLVPFLEGQTPQAARQQIGCPSHKTVITIIGTVCAHKGQHEFARASVELLRRGHHDLFFYIVGCRPSLYQDTLESLVRPFRKHFGLIPEIDHALTYLRASDIFVCCSSNETFPRVILEAMAFGLPIVTTAVFGINEQVVPNVSALTYSPGDVQALASHLEQLISSPAERRRLSEGASAGFNTLTSYDEMLESYEQLFLEAFLSGKAPATATSSPGLPQRREAA
jgi:glycosyltransferase involved in cell wall biosynthesis